MIGYVTLGTNDLPRAAVFYDELLSLMGAGRFMDEDTFIAWAVSPDVPAISVTKPYDGKAATVGNGTMVALAVKTTKHAVWLLFSLWTGFTFVGYFTPIRELWDAVLVWNLGPWETFWIFFYGFATYGNAGFMREQVCIYMCPWPRIQAAMMDEDTITISVEAARDAVARAGIDPARIGAVYIGSESHPYAVKPSGTVLIDALGIGPEVHVADFEFACKAGTEAMFVALGLVEAGRVEYAMGIGADTSQGAPDDALEFSASAGGRLTLHVDGSPIRRGNVYAAAITLSGTSPGTVIGEDLEQDEKRFHVTPGGVVLVTPEMLGQELHYVR